jgi:hypothetical protein
VLGAQRRDAAAVLLAGLSASMSILWCDSRSERLFDETESMLGIGISGESTPTLTFIFPLLTGARLTIRKYTGLAHTRLAKSEACQEIEEK